MYAQIRFNLSIGNTSVEVKEGDKIDTKDLSKEYLDGLKKAGFIGDKAPVKGTTSAPKKVEEAPKVTVPVVPDLDDNENQANDQEKVSSVADVLPDATKERKDKSDETDSSAQIPAGTVGENKDPAEVDPTAVVGKVEKAGKNK